MNTAETIEDEYGYPPTVEDRSAARRRVWNELLPSDFLPCPGEADAFLAKLGDLTEDQARALFRDSRGMCRWNAKTQAIILQGIRARYA